MADVLFFEESGLRRTSDGTLFPSDGGGGAPVDPGTGYHTVSSVSANGDDGNVPGNVLDDDPATRWSHNGTPAILTLDLGSLVTVGTVEAAFYKGNERATTFEIYTSEVLDTDLTLVQIGQSSGASLGYETFNFADIAARYVYIYGYGNNGAAGAAPWTSITMVRIGEANGTGSAHPSAPATAPSVTVGTETSSSVPLTWTEVADASSYEVYRDSALVVTTSQLFYTDTGRTAETSYDYQVRGINSQGDGPLSATVTGTTTAASSGGGGDDPDPTNLGSSFGTYVTQAGGQTIVIPNGNYSGGVVDGATHSGWLILKAETPGGVTVTDSFRPNSCSRVIFVGIHFDRGVYAGGLSAGNNDRLLWWYCTARAPFEGAENGIATLRGQRVGIAGCDIWDCYHDGIKCHTSDSITQGCRVWDVLDPNGVKHNDGWQSEVGSNLKIYDTVFGLNPAGQRAPDTHIQIQTSFTAPTTVRLERTWITGSNNTALMVDGKNKGLTCHADLIDCRMWGNPLGNANTSNGGTKTETRSITTAPTGSDTPPDVSWRAANPYGSYMTYVSSLGW